MSALVPVRKPRVFQLMGYAGVLILLLAYGIGWGALVMDPSAAAAALGPSLCPPSTEAVVRTGGFFTAQGRWEEDSSHALHCLSVSGQTQEKHGELFWVLWGARFIPHAALAVAVGLPLWFLFSTLRHVFSRARPAPAVVPPPVKKARRSRR